MRIDGAGACFDNRIYEVDMEVAWNLVKLCINEMGVTVDSEDVSRHLINFHNKDKIMQVALQQIDDESLQLIFDSTGHRLQIYSWKREDKEVNHFYELFEKKLCEYRAFILCPECTAKVSSLAKFCPECGAKLK